MQRPFFISKHSNSGQDNRKRSVNMKDKKYENREIELRNVPGQPETAEDMVNKYGTYNIQPTADTDNSFPKIAQGLAKPKNRKIK